MKSEKIAIAPVYMQAFPGVGGPSAIHGREENHTAGNPFPFP